MRNIELIRNNNTRARITIARDRITVTIPRHYSIQEEIVFMALCGELPYFDTDHCTMRARDSMYNYLTIESDSGKIKHTVEIDVLDAL
jgi:hypothetical protein